MSNALRKKKKPMQPLGYSRKELDAIHKTTKIQMEQRDIIGNVQFTLRNITFFLLYDRFQFGKVRLRNFAKGMVAYDNGCKISTEDVFKNISDLKAHTHIDLQECARKIPEKEKAKLAGAVKIRTQSQMQRMAFGVRTGYLSYLTVVLMVLRKQYRFSEKKLKEFMDLMQDHINSFYLELFADDDLIDVLSDEIGYQMKK